MNEAQKNAIRNAICDAQDDLYHAKLTQKSCPNWKSCHEETIAEVIEAYQAHLTALQQDFECGCGQGTELAEVLQAMVDNEPLTAIPREERHRIMDLAEAVLRKAGAHK